ncbi:MAG: ABC transporter ATP-binding protein [Pseudomonadota bacterium]
MLELKEVGKFVADETHIYPTSLKLEAGRFNTLLGTTLAGKTTLMQLIAGLEKPSSGEIWFEGKNVTGVAVQKRNISMVYQQFINYPTMSVFDNIASPLRVGRLPAAEIKKRVGEMAELLKISAMLDRRPAELSGGQQQRTAMARALVKDSDIVLLDEPLANLDFKLREELRDELPRIFAERNCVVVYATTEPSEALLLGGYTAALEKGRVADFGVSGEVYRRPASIISAKVFSEPPMNVASVTKRGKKVHLNEHISWTLRKDVLPDGDYKVGIRPHHVTPVKSGKTPVGITGTVKVAELSGSESMIHFDALGHSWISLAHGIHPFEAGSEASLFFDASNCLYFDAYGKLASVGEAGSGAH